MSSPAPISYYLELQMLDEVSRKNFFNELAAHGAKHLVLTSPFMAMVFKKPELAETVQKELNSVGMSFGDVHLPYNQYFDLNTPFIEARKAVTARHKTAMRTAAMLNCKTMTIHVGTDHLYKDISFEQHFSRACSMLEELLLEAEKLGVILCIENGWTQTTSTSTLLALREKFPSDSLGFCFDSGHANIMDNGRLYDSGEAYIRWNAIGVEVPPWEKAADKLRRLLPHVVNCHLHDNCGNKDQHQLPGNGNVNWLEITVLLKQAPRLKAIQSEVHVIRNGVPVRELVNCFENLFDKGTEK